MKKKTEEILLNLSRKFHKKKYLKIEQNKKPSISSSNKYLKTKEDKNENNDENFNNLNIPLKKIYFKEKENDDINIENIYNKENSSKITNGAYNNEINKIKNNKESKTINIQKSNRKFLIENLKTRNDKNFNKNNIQNYNNRNHNYKIMKYFQPNNNKINTKENIIEEPTDIDNSLLDKYSTMNNYDEFQPNLYFNEKENYKMENNIKHNNINNSCLNSYSSSKLFFDYKRISNLLINKNLGDNKYINKTNYNSFRKKNSDKKTSNININNNLYTPLNYEKFEKKFLGKNFSFNNKKKFLNNDDNNNDIKINNYKRNKMKNNSSSISLNNNSNVIERNYNLYFSPTVSNNKNYNNDYYFTSSKTSFKTIEKKNTNLSSQHSSSSNINNIIKLKNSNTLKVNNKRNRNKFLQKSYFDSNIKSEKYSSAIDVFKNNDIEFNYFNLKNQIPLKKEKSKNMNEKKIIFKKKNNSSSHFNFDVRSNQLKYTKMKNSKDLSDDISIYRNKTDIEFLEKLKENKKHIIYGYCSNYTQKESQNNKKTFCFNNFNNNSCNVENNNNNKINIKKQYIQNFEKEKNNIIEDKEINDIINKYKNKSISNSRQIRSQKLKNMIFTYERIFKNKTTSSHNNTNINENDFFMNNDNRNDINYKNNKKCKIKYLTPNTTKNKSSNNLILDNDGPKKIINEIKERERENENEKNLEFNYNITQSRSILDNIKFENNSHNGNLRKIKTLIRNSFSNKNENIKKLNQKNKKIPNREYIIKPMKEKNQINKSKSSYNNSFEISENSNSLEQINNNEEINLEYSDASPSSNLVNSNSFLNVNINNNSNNEYIKEIKKPIIIDNQSHFYENYGFNKHHNYKKKNIIKDNDYIFRNKSFKKTRKKNKSIFKDNNINKTKIIKCNCEKEYNEKNEEKKTIDSDNLLLITNMTKCPKCHCLFGKKSKLLKNKDNSKK